MSRSGGRHGGGAAPAEVALIADRGAEAGRRRSGPGGAARGSGGRSRVVRGTGLAAGLAMLAALGGCGPEEPDAWGSFEADEVVVSAEVGGMLLRFDASEGSRLVAGEIVAMVDTVQTALQLTELEAQRAAASSQTEVSAANVAALEAELSVSTRELARVRRLRAAEAATERQLEQATSRVEVLRQQIRAAREQTTGTADQSAAVEAKVAQLRDRLDRSRVRNPIAGTVLTTYVNAGEFVQPGQPLYRVANLDTLVLRAYVSGAQLAEVRIGGRARVLYDAGRDAPAARAGTVTWVASEAEFTPTPIQTREERADLVYAIEVRVPNPDGALKVGMPGEVELESAGAEVPS